MKNLMLITISFFLFISCSKDKKEQLFYDYQADIIKDSLNTDLKELNFKIIGKIEPFKNITAKDSVQIILKKIHSMTASPEMADSLQEGVTIADEIKYNKQLMDSNKELMNLAIKLGQNNYYEEAKKDWDKHNKAHSYAITYEPIVNNYLKEPDNVLAYGFKVKYSIKNPVLNNITQTFDKILYTDKEQNKIFAVEDLK